MVLRLQKEHGSLANYMWSFFPGKKPIQNSFKTMKDLPAKTDKSDEIAKALKKEGFALLENLVPLPSICVLLAIRNHALWSHVALFDLFSLAIRFFLNS